jgi:hypothetical protein
MRIRPYKLAIDFNRKKFVIFVQINKIGDTKEEYHYNLELRTKHKLSGNEFQKLKKYLEDEGYIDEAIDYYQKFQKL